MKSSHFAICLICLLLVSASSSNAQGIKDAYLSAATIYDTKAANASCDAKKNFFKKLADYNRCLAKKLETGQNVECTEPSLDEPACGQSSSQVKTNTDSRTKQTTTLPNSQNNNSKPYKGSQDAETYQRNIAQYKTLAANETCPQKKDYYNYMVQMFECHLNNVNSGGKTPCKGPIQEPVCQTRLSPTENGNLKEIMSQTSNAASKNPQLQSTISSINTLTDKNTSDETKLASLDQMLGNTPGTTLLAIKVLSLLDKSDEKTRALVLSYKKMKNYFAEKYDVDYDYYIHSVKTGNYKLFQALHKKEMDINMALIHHLPSTFEQLFTGNIVYTATLYRQNEFLKQILIDFPNAAVNYGHVRGGGYGYSESLEIAILSKNLEAVKLLVENDAYNKPPYRQLARDINAFEIYEYLEESLKKRKARHYKDDANKRAIDFDYIGFDDNNLKSVVKGSRRGNSGTWSSTKIREDIGVNLDIFLKNQAAEKENYLKSQISNNQTNEKSNNNNPSMADEIKKLKTLLDEGIITKEEFEAAKKKIIEKQ